MRSQHVGGGDERCCPLGSCVLCEPGSSQERCAAVADLPLHTQVCLSVLLCPTLRDSLVCLYVFFPSLPRSGKHLYSLKQERRGSVWEASRAGGAHSCSSLWCRGCLAVGNDHVTTTTTAYSQGERITPHSV